MSDLKRCWIVVDEYNYDIAERSWYIEPRNDILGRFSKAFVEDRDCFCQSAAIGPARRPSGLTLFVLEFF